MSAPEEKASPRRRLLLGALALSWLWPLRHAMAAARKPQQINVLTAYPDEVMRSFEQAFEKQYPHYRINFLWRMPHDALPWLREHARDGSVDVYWSASPRTFDRLKQEKLLRKLDVKRKALPEVVGKTRLADPEGYFTATEIAGYVFAINESALNALGVAEPVDWPQLADPRLRGQIALPVPSNVGFAPVMFDIVLQAYGWEKGWALWSEIAALSQLMRRGSTFITDTVGSGQAAIGLSMDFFVRAAIANGAMLKTRYPAHNGINPGQIALPAVSGNPGGAKAFVDFVLSETGQKLLLERDIRKLPVRPSVYPTGDNSQFNPFLAARKGMLDYDSERGRWRLAVISAVFDEMLAKPHKEIVELWQRLHAAEAAGKDANATRAIRALLCKPPLVESDADSEEVKQRFRNDLEGGTLPRQDLLEQWHLACAFERAKARGALSAIDA